MIYKTGNFYVPKSQSEVRLTGFVANWSFVKGFEDMYEYEHFGADFGMWRPKRLDELFYNRHFFGDINDMGYLFFDLLVPKNTKFNNPDGYKFELISRCYTTSLCIGKLPVDLRGKLITLKGVKHTESDTDGDYIDINWIEANSVKIHPVNAEKIFSGFNHFDVDFLSKTADDLWKQNYWDYFSQYATGDFILSTRPETMDIPMEGISDHWAEIMQGYFGWWETALFSK